MCEEKLLFGLFIHADQKTACTFCLTFYLPGFQNHITTYSYLLVCHLKGLLYSTWIDISCFKLEVGSNVYWSGFLC